MATSEIETHRSALEARGVSVGPALGIESADHSGGRVRRFGKGSIYFHPSAGAAFVPEGLQEKYVSMGGPGPVPGTQERLLGYPVGDARLSPDWDYELQAFEWGLIVRRGGEFACIWGAHYQAWQATLTEPEARLHARGYALGLPVTSTKVVGAGFVSFFEHGLVATDGGPGGPSCTLRFSFPPLGRPALIQQQPNGAAPLQDVMRRVGGLVEELPPTSQKLIMQAVAESMALRATGTQQVLPLKVVGKPEVSRVPIPGRRGLPPTTVTLNTERLAGPVDLGPASGGLVSRTLYDVVVKTDAGQWHAVAPHAYYARNTWSDFGLAHITDIHVARRIDSYRGRLRAAGRTESAQRLNSPNDNFRDFIAYANHLHASGLLDAIIATGDLVDHVFDDYETPPSGGNFAFLRDLILGRAPNDGHANPELRVPIFTTLGNHDYRVAPYHLVFNLGPKHFANNTPFNIDYADSLVLMGKSDTPDLAVDTAKLALKVDVALLPYSHAINDRRSFVVQFGSHRAVVLDSRWDVGIVDDVLEGIDVWFNAAEENEKTFAAGAPNCQGPSRDDLALLENALGRSEKGITIVGMHAPPLHPARDTIPFYLRETQRPYHNVNVAGHLLHGEAKLPVVAVRDNLARAEYRFSRIKEAHPTWFGAGGQFKSAGTDDLLDFGVSRGETAALLNVVAGVGGGPKADLVLCGHGHRNVEYRLAPSAAAVDIFTDFYLENPAAYYPAYVSVQDDQGLIHHHEGTTRVTVKAGAAPDAPHRPSPQPHGDVRFEIDVPPYSRPLSEATDKAAWWDAHRPLVVQTEALGLLKNPNRPDYPNVPFGPLRGPQFMGFRMINIRGDVIDSVPYITLDAMRASQFRMAWEAHALRSMPTRPSRPGGTDDVIVSPPTRR